MFLSRWTLFQLTIIILLVIAAFVVDRFKKDIAVPFSSDNNLNTPMILTALFIVVVIGLLSLFLYFQTKKSDTFLKHQLWDKMHIIMPILFGISLVVVFSFFLIALLSDMIQNNRWLIYVFIYYILFIINITVLAMIHKSKKSTISNENKVLYSFVWTSLGLLVVVFIS